MAGNPPASGISASSFSPGRKACCPDVSSGRQPPSLLPFQAVRPPVFRISPAEEFLFSHTWPCGRHLSYSPFTLIFEEVSCKIDLNVFSTYNMIYTLKQIQILWKLLKDRGRFEISSRVLQHMSRKNVE